MPREGVPTTPPSERGMAGESAYRRRYRSNRRWSQDSGQRTRTRRSANLLIWRSGYVFFRDTPLADAVAEFNRYNTRKIYIEDPAIAAVQIGGTFPR